MEASDKGPWSIVFQREMGLLGGKSLFKEGGFRWQMGEGTVQKARVALPVTECPLAMSQWPWPGFEAQEGSSRTSGDKR